MKTFDIPDLNVTLSETDLANLFNVYDETSLGKNFKTFNLNRTVNIKGLDNISSKYYTFYEVRGDDSWTLISYKYYGTTRLWWLICKANSIIDPTQQPEAGTKLKILNEDIIKSILQVIKGS
jgi:nucleoid-associated protein YgaU